jgi:hypothetical protein
VAWINTVGEALAPGWVGSLIGLAGLVAAVAIYFFTRQRTVLAYQARGQRLLGHATSGLPPEVTVQYEGREISKLTRSILTLWNAGEKTIAGSDIVEGDRLRLLLGDGSEILSAEIIQQSRAAIRSSVHLPKRPTDRATMEFDFLDHNDGFVVEVLHTGKEILPLVQGTIRGMPAGLRRVPTNFDAFLVPSVWMPSKLSRSVQILSRSVIVICLLFGIGLSGILIFAPSLFQKAVETQPPARLLATLLALTYLGLGCAMLYLSWRRYPKSLVVIDRQ